MDVVVGASVVVVVDDVVVDVVVVDVVVVGRTSTSSVNFISVFSELKVVVVLVVVVVSGTTDLVTPVLVHGIFS